MFFWFHVSIPVPCLQELALKIELKERERRKQSKGAANPPEAPPRPRLGPGETLDSPPRGFKHKHPVPPPVPVKQQQQSPTHSKHQLTNDLKGHQRSHPGDTGPYDPPWAQEHQAAPKRSDFITAYSPESPPVTPPTPTNLPSGVTPETMRAIRSAMRDESPVHLQPGMTPEHAQALHAAAFEEDQRAAAEQQDFELAKAMQRKEKVKGVKFDNHLVSFFLRFFLRFLCFFRCCFFLFWRCFSYGRISTVRCIRKVWITLIS